MMDLSAQPDLAMRLANLKVEHGDLDRAIQALEIEDAAGELQIKRLKKRKLQLKDEIVRLEDSLMPDIIA